MQKKGVSAVVATVLIIMITVAAVGIVWAVIIPMIRDNLGSSNLCNDVDISIATLGGYTCYDSVQKIVAVQVQKGPSDVSVSRIDFLLSSAGNSYSENLSYGFAKNEYHTFYLPASTLSSVDGISIAPVLSTGKSCGRISLASSLPNCNLGNVQLIGTSYYSIKYSVNGGTGSVPVDSSTYKSSDKVTVLSGDSLSKTNYVFAGWNTQVDGNGYGYGAGSKLNISSSNITLYAQWVTDDKIIFTGKTITSSGTYYLNQSFTGNLIINFNDVTINGNGFTVTGNVDASRNGYDEGNNGYSAYTNLVLNNINVTGDVVSYGSNDGQSDSATGGSIQIINSQISGSVSSVGSGASNNGASSGRIDISDSDVNSVVSTGGGNVASGSSGLVNITHSIIGSITSIGGSGAGGASSGAILVSNSGVGSITSTGGSSSMFLGGADSGSITITFSNVSAISSVGGEARFGTGGVSSAITITNSNISGAINSIGGGGDSIGGSGGNSNSIIITNSSTFAIISNGGEGYTGGSAISVTVTNSRTTAITAKGGRTGSGGSGGNGGVVEIVDSNVTVVDTSGEFAHGNGGSITIRGILTRVGDCVSKGGDGMATYGDGGYINILTPCPNPLTNIGNFNCDAGGSGGTPGICPHTCL